jgi:putative ABC transport system permease protein
MFFEFLRIGLGVLRAHKFRSALTVLSITIGAFSIVVMSSLAKSGIATIARGIEDVGGARMVIFFPKPPEKAERKRASYFRGLNRDDVEALRGRVPGARYYEMHGELGERDVRHGAAEPKTADLVAGNRDFLDAFSMKLTAGRNLDADDIDGRRKVALLGHGVAEALFPTPEAALGQVVRAGVESFRVIGVVDKVKRFGIGFGFDWNNFVLVPLGIGGTGDQGALIIVTQGTEHNDMAKRVAFALLSHRHRGVDDFQVFDVGAITEKFYAVFRIMQLIVAFIASIALLVGGVGVMNILLVSVSERVREIGLRKAIGASDVAIGAQFLFESALLSALGGLVGVGGGALAAKLIGFLISTKEETWVPVLSVEAMVGALSASALIGIFFGLLPARKASRLTVVDCLRAAG